MTPGKQRETERGPEDMKEPHKLLIVDDSKMMRRAIADIFDADNRVKVVGEAADGEEALEIILQLDIDVVTLDVEMPVMNGLTTLKHMMIEKPTPTVMISTLTHKGAAITFDALKYGAVDFVPKPSNLSGKDLKKQSSEIIRKVNLAAAVNIGSAHYIRAARKKKQAESDKTAECNNIIAMGAAEGGYGALLKIIPHLPPDFPGAFLIVLHDEAIYVDAFIQYLAEHSTMKITRARDGEPVKGGVCYLAPGEEYLTVRSLKRGPVLHVGASPFATRRGAVNMLMFSVAEVMGDRSAGVILSGVGSDGDEGIGEIVRVGGTAIVQDPGTCMYTQMPKSVLNKHRVDLVVPDTGIASSLSKLTLKQ